MGAHKIFAGRRSFVAGTWVEGDEVLAVENPADGTHLADVSVTPLPKFQRAIDEARRSFDEGIWADRTAKERAAVVSAFLDHFEAARDTLIATMVAEAGQPQVFADRAQFASGLELGRNTIELYLSMSHEDFNPVPLDELVRGRLALSILPTRASGGRHGHHPVQRGDHHGDAEAHPRPHGGQLGDPSSEPADADLLASPRRRPPRPLVCRRGF